jgi:hypothetical protein
MNYREINLINNTIIIPPNEHRSSKYCPREEIAHPLKLKAIIDNLPRLFQWDRHTYNQNTFHLTWVEWSKIYKSYNDYITTSLFHVLTEKPAMFNIFNLIISNPDYINLTKHSKFTDPDLYNTYITELSQWIMKWWNTPFLITILYFITIMVLL